MLPAVAAVLLWLCPREALMAGEQELLFSLGGKCLDRGMAATQESLLDEGLAQLSAVPL